MKSIIARFAKKVGFTRKHVLLDIPSRKNDGIFPGIMKGGVIKAEVLEETEKAFRLKFRREFLPLTFGTSISIHMYDEWMLKNDNRILEVLK